MIICPCLFSMILDVVNSWIVSSSNNAKTLWLAAMAVCISDITDDISLNGFVYWLAYVKKLERIPTVNEPFNTWNAPKIPTAA